MLCQPLRRCAGAARALTALCLLAGCAGNGPPVSAPGSTFDVIQRTIFDTSCLSAGCHNAADRQANLVLEAGQSYASLVNVMPFNPAAQAAGLLRVVPGNPDRSFLLVKLTAPGPDEGSLMPRGAPPLSAADVDLIRTWILAGAPGSALPTPTPSATASPSATATPSPTASATATASATVTPSVTATPTATSPPPATATGTLPPTPTVTPTPPPTATPTPSVTPSATPSASASATPSPVPTPTFSVETTLAQIQATIFSPTCLSIGCHNAQDAAGGQVLEPGQAYTSLVGVAPTNAAARAAGLLRVDPGRPDNSFLIVKLTLSRAFDPQFGSRMPLGMPPLAPQQIENIRAWILRGAPANDMP